VTPSRPHPDLATAAWWTADSLGAIAFAAGLALAIGRPVGVPNMAGPGLIVVGAAWRGLALAQARKRGAIAAASARRALCRKLAISLLPTRLRRGALVGEDMHLAVDAVAETDGLFARFLPLRAAASVSPILVALAAAPASPIAAAILLATLALFIPGMVIAGGAASRRAEAHHLALSRLSGLFVDRLRHLPTILGFAAEDRVARQLGAAAREVARRTLAVLTIAFVSSALLDFFAALAVAMVAVWCGFSLLGLAGFARIEHLTLARAFYVLALAPEFYLGMRRLAAAYHERAIGEAAMAAIAAAQDAALPPPVAPRPIGTGVWRGTGIVVRHDDGPTIGPIDWHWEPCALHVLTGPTGSGKSSLLLALIGQVRIADGTLTIGGEPITAGACNAQVGWAGQQVALLPGTLFDNLARVMPVVDRDAILACLGELGLSAMIERRVGLDCVIDHRGSGLSGGERRRIALARAILSARPILLLDEPTADLDGESAEAVRSVLARCAQDRMVVAATHDPALVALAKTRIDLAGDTP
jgi:ATP-binding cassette subfamily C protein CydD